MKEAVVSAREAILKQFRLSLSPASRGDLQMTALKIATFCILSAGTLAALLSTGIGAEAALALAVMVII